MRSVHLAKKRLGGAPAMLQHPSHEPTLFAGERPVVGYGVERRKYGGSPWCVESARHAESRHRPCEAVERVEPIRELAPETLEIHRRIAVRDAISDGNDLAQLAGECDVDHAVPREQIESF